MRNLKIILSFVFAVILIFSCKESNNKINKLKDIENSTDDSLSTIPDVFYTHLSGKWDNGEEVKFSLMLEPDYLSGYLLFTESDKYYDLSGIITDKNNIQVQAYGLNDSIGFVIKKITPETAEIEFYPPQSADLFIFTADYSSSQKIDYFSVDTTYSITFEDTDFLYEIGFSAVILEDMDISIVPEMNFLFKQIDKNGNYFYENILPEKLLYFDENAKFSAMDWYDFDDQEVIFNDGNIICIANYIGGYTGGASTWSSESYIIWDYQKKWQIHLFDVIEKSKKDEFYALLQKNGIPSDELTYLEPLYYFTNEYFYFTIASGDFGATRSGDIYLKIPINKLELYFTTYFKENILPRL
ncbi:MAG: hypothetical protein JXL97_04780 [Bacteroidales bacterium]|nr:hypothetical protein [Bacteroidales bacterium]